VRAGFVSWPTAVLLTGYRSTATGVIIGMTLAAIVARSLDDMLYSVTARDPLTFAVVTALLITVAVAGSYVPARRAMCVDPLVTLRHE